MFFFLGFSSSTGSASTGPALADFALIGSALAGFALIDSALAGFVLVGSALDGSWLAGAGFNFLADDALSCDELLLSFF